MPATRRTFSAPAGTESGFDVLHWGMGIMRNVFPERLQALRKRHGMSQKALACAMGVSTASVCKWEQGSILPRQSNIAALARTFKVSRSYFTENAQRAGGRDSENALGELVQEAKARIGKLAGIGPENVLIVLAY